MKKKYISKYIFKILFESKKFDLIKYFIDSLLRIEMVSSTKTFDVSKFGKMTEMTQTEYRFGIPVGFTYNIAYQTGFQNPTGNTKHEIYRSGFPL